MVHTEPRAPRGEHFFEAIRAVAQRMGLSIHDLSAQQQDDKTFVEFHLEVDENLSLKDAHRKATDLEEAIRQLRGNATEVNIHIEPLGKQIVIPDQEAGTMRQLEMGVDAYLNGLAAEHNEIANCHDVRVRQVEHRILVSCHCAMKSALAISTVHDVTATLESRVKERFPQVYRVTIHPEPLED
jgi:divalent metal cation (Fe/Co/Zn/Cd) transporter